MSELNTVLNTGKHTVKVAASSKPITAKYKLNNQTVNGSNIQSMNFAAIGQSVQVTSDVVNDSGEIQTQLDQTLLGYPPILALPVNKFADGKVIDEIYFQTTIVNGVITATGSFPSGGNWQLLTDRVNKSLEAIKADWAINSVNVSFIVS